MLESVAEILCPENKTDFSKISLSRQTITRRVDDIGKHIEDNLKNRASKFIFYALALDESTDLTDTAHRRFLSGVLMSILFNKIEELAALHPLKDTTRSRDLLGAVTSTLNCFSLQLDNLSGVTTDGAPAMVGKHEGLVKLIENEDCKVSDSMLNFHCIIHQEYLCSKSLKMDHVMKVVIKTVNFIKSKGLNQRQFQEFLKSLDSQYNDVTFYVEVSWLTRAKILKRVFDLNEEIQSFFTSKSKSFLEFEDKEWVSDFAFLVDIVSHLNVVNTRLQWKDLLINNMYDLISAFQMKLGLWEQQLRTKIFTHFPTLLLQPDVTQTTADKYSSLIYDLNLEFDNRFQDFKKHRELFAAFATPFFVDVNLLPGILQMEHCEMCCDSQLKEKFNQVGFEEFYKLYLDKEKYLAFYKHALSMISHLSV